MISEQQGNSAAPVRARQLLTLKQASKALVFVILYVAAVVGLFLLVALVDLFELTLAGFLPAFLGLVTAAAMLALYVHLVPRNGLSFADLGFQRPGPRMAHLLWQVPTTIVSAAVVQGLFFAVLLAVGLDPAAAQSTNDPLQDLRGLPWPTVAVVVITVAVATPLWEEVLFRGAFLDGFSRRFQPWAAITLSAALFAAVHLVLVGFVYLFVLGVALALLRRFHDNLWAPVILHAVNNGLVTLFALTAA